jgi:2,3-bisphosphoglycerate-dependent phosphoglycerate mutase
LTGVGYRPGVLVVVRHGESVYNAQDRFTGWTDVPLTIRGREEARRVGARLRAAGIHFDQVYTSVLQRTIDSAELIVAELEDPRPPIVATWRLNERHYGALQGLDHAQAEARYGAEQVRTWRRSYASRPPAADGTQRQHRITPESILPYGRDLWPTTESLADVVARLTPLWDRQIAAALACGAHVLIVGHGNSLRALVKYLEELSDVAIESVELRTGEPFVYTFDGNIPAQARIPLEDFAAKHDTP